MTPVAPLSVVPLFPYWIFFPSDYLQHSYKQAYISVECAQGFRSLGCDALSVGEWFMTLWRMVLPPSSLVRQSTAWSLEDEGNTVLWNTRNYSPSVTASHPRRPECSATPLQKCQLSHWMTLLYYSCLIL